MKKLSRLLIPLLAVAAYSGHGFASEFGTPEQARTMLERAVAALEADKPAALEAFNREDGGYRDRDLYVFCADPDGMMTAHANPRGVGRWNLKRFKDITGKPVGEEMFNVATEGKFSTITYLSNRKDDPLPQEKTSFVTKVDDQLCGVGYYNPQQRARTGNLAINSTQGIVIEGYDPVAYFTMGKATKGSKEFTYEWLESQWHFASAEHRDMFVADPIKYTPQYGGFCAASLSGGNLAPVDPEAWRIVDGKLYLYFSERHASKWANDPSLSAKADANWKDIKPKLTN